MLCFDSDRFTENFTPILARCLKDLGHAAAGYEYHQRLVIAILASVDKRHDLIRRVLRRGRISVQGLQQPHRLVLRIGMQLERWFGRDHRMNALQNGRCAADALLHKPGLDRGRRLSAQTRQRDQERNETVHAHLLQIGDARYYGNEPPFRCLRNHMPLDTNERRKLGRRYAALIVPLSERWADRVIFSRDGR